jgi:hypothetical protein
MTTESSVPMSGRDCDEVAGRGCRRDEHPLAGLIVQSHDPRGNSTGPS